MRPLYRKAIKDVTRRKLRAVLTNNNARRAEKSE
jgi:hypothetical protein